MLVQYFVVVVGGADEEDEDDEDCFDEIVDEDLNHVHRNMQQRYPQQMEQEMYGNRPVLKIFFMFYINEQLLNNCFFEYLHDYNFQLDSSYYFNNYFINFIQLNPLLFFVIK